MKDINKMIALRTGVTLVCLFSSIYIFFGEKVAAIGFGVVFSISVISIIGFVFYKNIKDFKKGDIKYSDQINIPSVEFTHDEQWQSIPGPNPKSVFISQQYSSGDKYGSL